MGFKCLDVGCGFSGETIIGEKYRARARGDVNIDIGLPEAKIPNFIRASAASLPFKEGTFDTVYMSHILEHLEEPEKAINEAYKVLKKSGKLIAITPNRYSKSSYLDQTHKQHFTSAAFKKLFNYFSDVKLVGEEGCLIPLKGNTKLWGKLVAKIFPNLAKDFKVIARK